MLCPPVKKIQVYQTFLFSFYSCQNWSSGMRFPKIPTLPLSYLKYSGDLNTKLVWYSNGQKEVECHLNTGQMDALLFSFVLVWYLNGRSST